MKDLTLHNRLDRKLSSSAFSDPRCGSLNLETQAPEFCCEDCPILLLKEPSPVISEIHKQMAGLPCDAEIAKKQARGK